jgi:hypothetical protein
MRPRCLLTWEQAMQATDSGWLSQLCVRAAHVVMSYQVPLQRAALVTASSNDLYLPCHC